MHDKFKKSVLLFLTPVVVILLFFCLWQCGSKEYSSTFVVKDFKALTNWHTYNDHGQKFLSFDYNNALQGFVLPSVRQCETGFQFEFMIKNTGQEDKVFFYKIFYQNDSYKFKEYYDLESKSRQHPLAHENFYGSWEDSSMFFLKTPVIPADGRYHKVESFLRIKGNPRFEERYYNNGQNDRWKRNPRVGDYSFMLVVTEESLITEKIIPPYIQNITQTKNGQFINPFHFFLYGRGHALPKVSVTLSERILNTIARPEMQKGIYCHPGNFPDTSLHTLTNELCNTTDKMRKEASFQQFIHYIDPSTRFNNIPLIRDVINDGYTLREYNWNKMFYRKEEKVSTTPQTAVVPCENVYYAPDKDAIVLRNPASSYGQWRKENAGVRTIHSFSYGTYTMKADLTRLLNDDGLWNGIVNTMWLLNQSNDAWNKRRLCSRKGYMATYWGGPDDERVPHVSYAEIDFEILKTVPYCPPYKFPPAYMPSQAQRSDVNAWHKHQPVEVEAQKNKIVVACTNWDMACWEPENFDVGCQKITYKDQTFMSHRWDHWYRALTQKSLQPDAELFGGPYYFQIEWKPEEIIWRIGPSKDNMRVVGYMNSSVTSIPNNQMFLIVTQEFHNTQWWVGAPFQQGNIPFPKNDIKGYIYDITIE